MPDNPAQLSSTGAMMSRISLIAGAFSVAVIVLLLINFKEMRKNDPLSPENTRIMNELVMKHRSNPADEEVKKEIQVLDQRMRQDYFNSLAKAHAGSFLLVAGLIIFIACMNISLRTSKALPGKP